MLRGLAIVVSALAASAAQGIAQVANALWVCRATIYKLCERGELAHVRVSNAIRFEPENVANLKTLKFTSTGWE